MVLIYLFFNALAMLKLPVVSSAGTSGGIRCITIQSETLGLRLEKFPLLSFSRWRDSLLSLCFYSKQAF